MNLGQTVSGQRYKWKLLEKLGEGDAGEVYLVQSFLEENRAILKRPLSGAYFSDIFRQANQIHNEANILKALQGLSFPDQGTHIHIPRLLDQSPPEGGFSENFFIIVEKASGFDLRALRQVTRFGVREGLSTSSNEEMSFFINTLADYDTIPQHLLVRATLAIINLLETIHFCNIRQDEKEQAGIIWNDIKPEHLYWDPEKACLSFIDWGNSQFLEQDGTTKDRQYSRKDDYSQFIQEMGNFIHESNPDLYSLLEWQEEVRSSNGIDTRIKPLKARLTDLFEEQNNQLGQLRLQESSLYGSTRPQIDAISQSEVLSKQIVTYGELPDFSSAINFHTALALQMASEGNLIEYQEICERTARLASSSAPKWELLARIAAIAERYQDISKDNLQARFSTALAAGTTGDWAALLWELAQVAWRKDGSPDWWEGVSNSVRQVHLQLDKDSITPYIRISRLFYTLQSTILQLADQSDDTSAERRLVTPEEVQSYQHLMNNFHEEVVKKWIEFDPAPPDSGIDYSEIDRVIEKIETIIPGTQAQVTKILAQPKAQAEIVLSAWERKEFEIARRALRSLLVWDPDRRRLLAADLAMQSAPQWLAKVHQGADNEEPFYDYITSVELEGRRLRNQVGAGSWLDDILDALKRLRKQAKHADLIMEHPEILNEIPWLSEHRSREILSLPRSRPLTLERDTYASTIASSVRGVQDGKLGMNQDLVLAEPLDAWIPEARGSSARVFNGYLRSRADKLSLYAIKVMRPDRMDYALPLFREEVQILTLLRDVPGVTPLVECGYMRLNDGFSIPGDESRAPASNLEGLVIRYGIEETQNYLASIDRHLSEGWLPYLALEKRDQTQNLMVYCDAGYTRGWFLPLRESLLLAAQICDILQSAHERNIVYRDHKLLHYYWDPGVHGIAMIDWNIAKRYPQGLSDAERQFDLVQFGARALHHILTGRPAPGALPLGPNRPEDIEHSASSYTVNWTYDDERLPNRVKEILEQVLNQEYIHAKELKFDLVELLEQIPNPV
jgi:serine/threonine protein kinase